MTWWIVAAVVAAVLWFGIGKRIWGEFTLGAHLVRMTNVFEQMLADAPNNQLRPEDRAVMEQGIAYMRSLPRHVVTRELLKNSMVAENLGRDRRVVAMGVLFDLLVKEGVALGGSEFTSSYGR